VRVLSLTHNDSDPSGIFGELARERGHDVEERSLTLGRPPVDPVERYDAVLVFGGTMHTHEETDHPWLRSEKTLLRRALDHGVPVLGSCLGGQLLADAAGGTVRALEVPEVGWYDVELVDGAGDDPIFGALPATFCSYQWHSYNFDLPEGAELLATSERCLQAFRLDGSWGLQFHAEVDFSMIADWISHYDTAPEAQRLGLDSASGLEDARGRIARWNELGRALCGRFLDFAEARTG